MAGPQRIEELIRARAQCAPDRIALVDESKSLSYAELDRATDVLARRLTEAGVTTETLVALHVPRSVEMVIGIVGILKAGGAYLPLDVDYPTERLQLMMEDSNAKVVVTTSARSDELFVTLGAHVVLVEAFPEADVPASPIEITPPKDGGLIYVMYTSGSTGRPKGVMNTHNGVTNTLLWMEQALDLSENDVFLQKTSVSFDVSVLEILMPLMIGAKLVLARPGGESDPEYIGQVIAGEKITIVHFVPTMLRAFLPFSRVEQLASLRIVVSSGEALDLRLAKQCLASVPAELINLYGPTETSIEASFWWCARGQESVPIGHPIANTELFVLDEAQKPAEAGELYIGGAGLARGYWKRPEETAARFVPHPFSQSDDARLYRTGDRAQRRPDGAIELFGRMDTQVKIRGFRVELGEVERALESHSAVASAVTTVRESSSGGGRLWAFVTLDAKLDDIEDELKASLAEKLPAYMVPSEIVVLDELPRLPNGKLDRTRLQKVDVIEAPPKDGSQDHDVLDTLVEIAQHVLGVPNVRRADSLLELGATSIDRLHFAAEAQARGLELSLSDIRDEPHLSGLAVLAEGRRSVTSDGVSDEGEWPRDFPMGVLPGYSLEALAELGEKHGGARVEMPSPLQANFIAMSKTGLEDAAVLTMEWDVDGAVDLDRLQSAWTNLLARHDALRSSYLWSGLRQPVRIIHPSVDSSLRSVEEALSPIRYDQPPLVELRAHTEQSSTRLILRAHHAALDGWSVDTLLSELWATYDQPTAKLEPAPSYGRYARWTAAQDLGPAERVQRRLLDSFQAPDRIPGSDLSPCEWDGGPRAEAERWLSEEESAGLCRWAKAAETTPFAVVFAGWTLALAKLFSSTDLVHSVLHHGREAGPKGVERLIGPTLFPSLVRIRFGDADSVTALLARIDGSIEASRGQHYARNWSARWIANGRINPWCSRFIDESFHSLLIDRENKLWDDQLGRRMRLRRFSYPDAEPLSTMLFHGPRLGLMTTFAVNRYSQAVVERLLADTHRAALEISQTRRLKVTDVLETLESRSSL